MKQGREGGSRKTRTEKGPALGKEEVGQRRFRFKEFAGGMARKDRMWKNRGGILLRKIKIHLLSSIGVQGMDRSSELEDVEQAGGD